MKYNFKHILFVALAAGLVSGCANDDSYGKVDSECVTLTPTKTVQDIYAVSTGIPQLYAGDDIIEAYVTSSDAGGTFYKSISFQTADGTRAFSVPVDMYNIYTEFEPGRKVYVNMKGRTYNTTFGSLIIGDLYQGAVGRLVPAEFRRTVKASCESVDEEVLVQHMTINEAKNNININKLIEFDFVQFEDAAMNTTYYNIDDVIGGATNINLVDADGNSVIFRTSEFAKFAGKEVAPGNGKIRGVMTKYNSDFQFMARTEADIKLEGHRVVLPLDEPFTNGFANWTKFSVTGAQIWTIDATHGNPGACAKMSGFFSGNNNNEDWLISPVVNLSGLTTANLTFDTATNFAGNVMQVYVSTNYSGAGSPNAAGVVWTPVSGTLAPSNSNYVWTHSGNVNISSVAGGNAYVAFKYTSTTSASATWEVDNVRVTGN